MKSVVIIVIALLFGYLTVQLGAGLLNSAVGSMQSSLGGTPTDGSVFDPATVHTFGVCGAGLCALSVITMRFGRRQSTEAWRIGAEGERLTGKALERLPSSYRVLHDLPMPGSRGNIDHVVAGPTGLFTVETKNYKNGVTIKQGRAFSNGRNLGKVIDQARRQADAVTAKTGATAQPIVCVHGQGVSLGWFQTPVVDGVRFCSGGRLAKTIKAGKASISQESAGQLLLALEGAHRP